MRLKIAILLAALLFIFGCNVEKRATKHLDKGYKISKVASAKWSTKFFPCIISAVDTSFKWRDSLVYVECPSIDTTYRHDTMVISYAVTKVVKVPVHLPIKTETIIIKIKDSAQIFLLADQINKLLALREQDKVTIDKLNKKISNKNKEIWLWRILAAIGIGYIFRKQIKGALLGVLGQIKYGV